MQSQPSRLALAGRFVFNFAVAPMLLLVALVGVIWVLRVIGIINVNG